MVDDSRCIMLKIHKLENIHPSFNVFIGAIVALIFGNH